MPISLLSVPDRTDHAQGEPMHICVKNAGATIAHRFVKSGDACSEATKETNRGALGLRDPLWGVSNASARPDSLL